MNPRDKHLLEVFQGLGEGESDTPQPPPVETSPPAAPSEPRRAVRGARPANPPLWVGIGIALVLSFLFGWFVGRGGVDDGGVVQAGGRGPQSDPLAFLETESPVPPPSTAQGGQDELAPFAEAGAALAHEGNEYTVVAITYDRTESNVDLAWSTAYHFADRGLPAGAPYGRGEALFILVGAAPTAGELKELRDRVRVQVDPSGRRRQYESAYIAPIDSVLTDR